jgi:hypothetical protein
MSQDKPVVEMNTSAKLGWVFLVLAASAIWCDASRRSAA